MKDGGYLCSCMTLQHVGIVCRHYFHLITRVPKCRYHIALIPRRWFHEQHQGLKDADLRIQPFLGCTIFEGRVRSNQLKPSDNYMGFVRDILPMRISEPALSRDEATKQWRFSNVLGAARSIADMASDHPEAYNLVERGLKDLLLALQAQMSGSLPVKPPIDMIFTGRLRQKRILSTGEKPGPKPKKTKVEKKEELK
ncbi:hypothetical protein B0O80DRAFT_528609 [Mortierella sp. GBAus27b]|nr:hypothetical protein B0O80DRAFT_528609 [Mortierella sp. GBAus27b]